MEYAIRAKDVSSFAGSGSLRDVSFLLPAGSAAAIISRNGESITALFHTILNIIALQSGIISIFGISSTDFTSRNSVFYIPKDFNPMSRVSVIRFFWSILGIFDIYHSAEVEHQTRAMIKDLNLNDNLLSLPLCDSSFSTKQKIMFMAALLINPRLLLIDNSMYAIDPASREVILDILHNRYSSSGGTSLIASTDLLEAELISDFLLVIDDGCVAFSGDPELFQKEQNNHHSIREAFLYYCTKLNNIS